MAFRPGISAATDDSRFRGIERVDIRARYGAYFDGASHPLAALGLAAAQAKFPGLGLTASTNLATFETDDAAIMQWEADAYGADVNSNGFVPRGSIGGIADGARVRSSRQIKLRDARRCWLHGGRDVTWMTKGVGPVAALWLTSPIDYRGVVGSEARHIPLRGIKFYGQDSEVYVDKAWSDGTNRAGRPHSGFRAGSAALLIDNLQHCLFESLGFNGFDTPTTWGDNLFCTTFRTIVSQGNNYGVCWVQQPKGLNSAEKMRFEDGSISNNNWNVYVDLERADNNQQSGSFFFDGLSMDYPAVGQFFYRGAKAGDTSIAESFHIRGCHIETDGAMTGTNVRGNVNGKFFLSDNECYEGGNGNPSYWIQVGDEGFASAVNNSFNQDGTMAIFGSATTATKYIGGTGNRFQTIQARPVLLRDGNGDYAEPVSIVKPPVFPGSVPATMLGVQFQGMPIRMDNSQAATVTLPNHATVAHGIGLELGPFRLCNAGTVTVVLEDGTAPNSVNNVFSGIGSEFTAYKYAKGTWVVRGKSVN